MPIKTVINIEVGEEVVLYVRTANPLLGRLAKMSNLKLRLNCGVARNEFGPLGFLLFWVPYKNSPGNALAIFDLYVNISSQPLMASWTELAHQTHWHVFLLDESDKQRNFWEFANTFCLTDALKEITAFCKDVPLLDFKRAREKFIAETSLEALHALTSRSEVNADGNSIFDASNVVPSPPAFPHPLKSARFASVMKESQARHGGSESATALEYVGERFANLAAEMATKTFVYLDVCHWINLRHVWLQSAKALPIYEKIVDRLKYLADEEVVICPLSAPIFGELMKQGDPLSRAATANLMEIFSRGICVRSFKESLGEQWKVYSAGKLKPENKISGMVTKVGFWLPERVLRRVFWSPETDGVWDQVSADLRWHLTMDDYQRLVALGEAAKVEEPSFLTKWRDLPAEQRLKKKTFAELLKNCRRDIFEAYSKDSFGVESDGPANHLVNSLIEGAGYGWVPSCEIVAGMCAAHVHQGGRVRDNDVFDFVHAGIGIPSCRAYFCDGPMERLLRKKPLQIDIHFDATIRSRPEEMLDYLESIN